MCWDNHGAKTTSKVKPSNGGRRRRNFSLAERHMRLVSSTGVPLRTGTPKRLSSRFTPIVEKTGTTGTTGTNCSFSDGCSVPVLPRHRYGRYATSPKRARRFFLSPLLEVCLIERHRRSLLLGARIALHLLASDYCFSWSIPSKPPHTATDALVVDVALFADVDLEDDRQQVGA